jgi:hypothetical protein
LDWLPVTLYGQEIEAMAVEGIIVDMVVDVMAERGREDMVTETIMVIQVFISMHRFTLILGNLLIIRRL